MVSHVVVGQGPAGGQITPFELGCPPLHASERYGSTPPDRREQKQTTLDWKFARDRS